LRLAIVCKETIKPLVFKCGYCGFDWTSNNSNMRCPECNSGNIKIYPIDEYKSKLPEWVENVIRI